MSCLSVPFYDCSTLASDIHTSSVIRVAHLNCRSLLSAIDDVRRLIVIEGIDILALTETWLDESIDDSEVSLAGYSILRKDRNRRGGGVAFIISNQIRFKSCSEISEGQAESTCIICYGFLEKSN